jgi:hypothetical protein
MRCMSCWFKAVKLVLDRGCDHLSNTMVAHFISTPSKTTTIRYIYRYCPRIDAHGTGDLEELHSVDAGARAGLRILLDRRRSVLVPYMRDVAYRNT